MIIKINSKIFNKLVRMTNKADSLQKMIGMPANNIALIKKCTVLEDNTFEIEISDKLFEAYLDMGAIYMDFFMAGVRELENHQDKIEEIIETLTEEFSI